MIGSQDFKRAMARLTGAVTIITTCDEQGQPWGFTATAFCSLSLNPPLVLCCLHQDADCHQTFLRRHAFAVNILSEQQCHLASRFATKGRAKYEGLTFVQGRLGLPLLTGTLLSLECSVHNIVPGGDHSILIGQVETSEQTEDETLSRPLLYYAQAYGTFQTLPPTEK